MIPRYSAGRTRTIAIVAERSLAGVRAYASLVAEAQVGYQLTGGTKAVVSALVGRTITIGPIEQWGQSAIYVRWVRLLDTELCVSEDR